jgi:opacity protein-like surface antigen
MLSGSIVEPPDVDIDGSRRRHLRWHRLSNGHTTLLGIALSLTAACAAPGAESTDSGAAQHLGFVLGGRAFSDDLDPVQDQVAIGVEYALERPGSLLGWELGLEGSKADEGVLGLGTDIKTLALFGGVRKTLPELAEKTRPYLGAGLALLCITVDVEGAGSFDDSSTGGYVRAGIRYEMSENVFLALDGRSVFGTDMSLGISEDGDFAQLALILGFSF